MKVVYATPSSFRTVNAGALRNINVANALAYGGHEVILLYGDGPDDQIAEEWEGLAEASVRLVPGGARRAGRLSRLRRVLSGIPVAPGLVASADAIILYNPTPFQYVRVSHGARLRGVRLLVDITEWLNPRELPGGLLSPYSWLYEGFMRMLPQLLGARVRALAISAPMAAYLSRKGADVLVVPPLSAVHPARKRRDRGPRRLVVSGSGIARGGKDAAALGAIIRLAKSQPEVLEGFEIDVLGALDPRTSRALSEVSDRIPVVEHGWQAWERTLAIVGQADWMLLLRDSGQRRHRLGYPSKVIESLALGVPVIVNRCGGVTDYLQDGVDAIVLDNGTDDEVVNALSRARFEWHYVPEARFDPGNWSKRLSAFIFGR